MSILILGDRINHQINILLEEDFCYIELMSQCQQARILLTQIQTLQEQLSQEWRIANREWSQKKHKWYEQNLKFKAQELISQLESMLFISEQAAERILREKQLFLGSEAVKELFDVELKPADIPPIPFSEKELEKAAEQGSVLMLVINQDKDGNPLTAKRIGEITTEKLKTVDPEFQKLFYDTNWYQDEPFYTTNVPLTSMQEKTAPSQWILISKKTLPKSKNKNFLEQTFLLAKHLKNNILPQIKNKQRRQPYLEALAELATQRKTLQEKPEFFDSNAWNQLTDEQKISLAQLLTTLKINQLTRPDFATMIYLQAMYLKVYHQYLFAKEYTLVNETGPISPGRFVLIGGFDRAGVHVDGWTPLDRSGLLGVSFLSSL